MSQVLSLQGRSAIVTGSARRIGRAIAIELANCGAAVMINSRSDEAAAKAAAEKINAMGGRASYCVADVTKEDEVERMIAKTVSEFGGLDILVNNAAVRPNAPFEQVSLETWREVISVVLDGAFLCSRAASPHLRKSEHGRIINIGGAGAHMGTRNRSHVMTAKAGIVGFTRSLTLEFAGTATVNCVVPGMIEDDLDEAGEMDARRKRTPVDKVPVGRPGHPTDVASMVAFIASDAASYVNGQTLHVSGGMYMP